MKTQFSVKESDFRTYSNAELSKFINVNLSGENINYNDIIESLPPKKQLLAYALIELYKRKDEKDIINLSSSKSVYNVFKSLLSDLDYEEFWVAYLDRANNLKARIKISSGGLHEASVDVRIILKYALKYSASSIILAHNHPSGSLTPSMNDNAFTQNIYKAAKLMNIDILDHLIIGKNAYYSYSDEGKL